MSKTLNYKKIENAFREDVVIWVLNPSFIRKSLQPHH